MKNNEQDYEENYTDEQLSGLHTKQLINLKNGVNALRTRADDGRLQCCQRLREYVYVMDGHDEYLKRIKAILSTREHIPNKQEAKELRKKKQFQNKHR